MKKFIESRKILSFIDRLNFFHILVIWMVVVAIFGLFYFFASGASSLVYTKSAVSVKNLWDTIYFSFVASTTTGFGDIVPTGWFKLIAIAEVVSGFLLLALVTSKLVSIKQDMILSELYELSLSEKFNRLRSTLILFRQNLGRILTKVEEGTLKKREALDLYLYISSFEDCVNETLKLLDMPKNGYSKNVDRVNMELIANSIIHSLERLGDLLVLMDESKIDWRREITLDLISRSLKINDQLFKAVNVSGALPESVLADMNIRKNNSTSLIKSVIAP